MFTDVNENDAKAAVKIWGEQIAKEKNVPTDPLLVILKGMYELSQSLQKKQVDAVGITIIEYDQLRRVVEFSPIFVTSNSGNIFERSILLAHRDGPVKTLADLIGRSLVLHSNQRNCLAPKWLDILLIKDGHPEATSFVGKISKEAKLAKVVLPVFFRKTDACVVTRRGFDTMAELNPQLARELVVLSESPEVIPSLFAFRADYNPAFKEKLISGLNELNLSSAGRQMLTIFQCDDIEVYPASCLDTALELLSTHKQLIP